MTSAEKKPTPQLDRMVADLLAVIAANGWTAAAIDMDKVRESDVDGC